MAFTANKNLEQPARGSNVGVWDTPVNSNMGILDLSLGGSISVALTNSNITLSSPQYQCTFISFTGAISANIAVTLPAVGSFYTIQNLTSNTSAFYITMGTTAAGGQSIGIPPGNPTEIFTDGTNVKFRGLPQVGSHWDYAGSSVPTWLSACTVPPWLNEDGTAFSSATYPILATVLGGTTLPDSRGRSRFTLNQGTARLSTAAGLDGNTNLAGGGGVTTLSSQNVPPVLITDPGHVHTPSNGTFANFGGTIAGVFTAGAAGGGASVTANVTGITAGNLTPTSFNAIPPGFIGGLSFIRAA